MKSDDSLMKETSGIPVKETKVKSISVLLKILMVIVPLLIVVSFLLYYFLVFSTPKNVLERMYKNLVTVDNFGYSLQLDFRLENNQSGKELLKDTNSEYLNIKNSFPANYGFIFKGRVNKQNGILATDPVFSVSSDGKDIAQGNLIIQNKELFIKVNDFLYSDLVQKELLGSWIRIDKDFWKENYGIIIDKPQNPTANLPGGKTGDFLQKHPPLTLIESLPQDTISGEVSYHYKYLINKDNLITIFLDKFANYFVAEERSKNMLNVLQSINFSDGDIWIGKKTGKVNKVKETLDITNVGSEGNRLVINFEVSIDNNIQKVDINSPENSVDIRNLLH